MTRTRIFLSLSGLVLLASLAWSQEIAGPTQPVVLKVLVPADAQVEIDGVLTKQTGPERLFQSPPLPMGRFYYYSVKATWKDQDRPIVRNETVKVRPGMEFRVDLRGGMKLDVPYVPTPQIVVDKMLEMGKVTKDDMVYDLGCGDGRIVVTAAKKYGAKGVGIDIDPKRVKESRENAQKETVEGVEFREGDILKPKIDGIDQATVVTLYLLKEINLKIRPMLQKSLKPGSRIVSHDFDMGDWKADKTETIKDETGKAHTIYLWEIKAPEDAKEKEKAKEKEREQQSNNEGGDEEKKPDVIYVPTPQAVVDKMLELAEVKKTDLVYDLGCGDGRIVVTAAKKFGVKAVGFDIDPNRIKDSLRNVEKNQVGDLVTIEQKDIFTLDLSKANVVTLYLLPELNVKLIPQLEKLKPGSRIVSHDFDMQGVKPKQVLKIKAKDDEGDEREHDIYLWVTPLEKEQPK